MWRLTLQVEPHNRTAGCSVIVSSSKCSTLAQFHRLKRRSYSYNNKSVGEKSLAALISETTESIWMKLRRVIVTPLQNVSNFLYFRCLKTSRVRQSRQIMYPSKRGREFKSQQNIQYCQHTVHSNAMFTQAHDYFHLYSQRIFYSFYVQIFCFSLLFPAVFNCKSNKPNVRNNNV